MSTNISVYPNPFGSALWLEVAVEMNMDAIVRILNQHEKIIKMLSWNLQKGINETTLNDLDALPAGTYYMEIRNPEGVNIFSTKLKKV